MGPAVPSGALHLHAQEVAPPDSIVSPGGAFLRSVLVPGWGHVATRSYTRAGFYVVAQAGSLWMLSQTLRRRAEAERFLRFERNVATSRLRASGVLDSDSVSVALDADPDVQARRTLVESRDQQVEDWAALSIFLVLLGATDAFVAAHLSDYPEPLASIDVYPVGPQAAEVRFSLPVGRLP